MDLNIGGTAGRVLVFEADVDTRAAGQVYFGLRSGDIGNLQQFVDTASAIDRRFAGCFDRVFTATWDSVGYYDRNSDPVSTLYIIVTHFEIIHLHANQWKELCY